MNALIIDDQIAGCSELASALKELVPDIDIHCEYNSRNLEIIYNNVTPDVIFLDIEMPGRNGFDCLKILRELGYEGLIIFETAHDEFILQALREQAFDYLLKPIVLDELQSCLERLAIIEQRPRTRITEKLKSNGLTKREIEVALEMLKGDSSEEISQSLFISKNTVDTHRRRILEKTCCRNTAELISVYSS